MSELNDLSFQEKAAANTATEPPLLREPANPPSGTARLVPLALAFSIVALAGVVWLAWDTQTRADTLRLNVGQKLADAESQSAANIATLKQLQAQFNESQSRVALLEGKLADMQTQRIALEEMYRELARSPDDWLLAEIEQTLNIAAQQLQLAGNVRAAVMALQTADARLARADKLQTVQLRRALNQDLEKLKALPLVDSTGISIKLDTLVNLVDSLPLMVSETSPTVRAPDRQHDPSEGWMKRVLRDAWDEFRQLVRIREIESNELALLTPTQSYFLRENLKLRLLSARHAMLAHDDVSYKEDLKQAREWLNRYFDPKAKVNVAASATLKQLLESAISIAVPDINASTNAVRAARAAREKPAR
jgi:uncharacterized protein HemX